MSYSLVHESRLKQMYPHISDQKAILVYHSPQMCLSCGTSQFHVITSRPITSLDHHTCVHLHTYTDLVLRVWHPYSALVRQAYVLDIVQIQEYSLLTVEFAGARIAPLHHCPLNSSASSEIFQRRTVLNQQLPSLCF